MMKPTSYLNDERFFGLKGAKPGLKTRSVFNLFEQYRAHIAARDLYYPYVEYPYLEWYSENGRVVLELDQSQLEVVKVVGPLKAKTPEELREDEKKREKAFRSFLGGMAELFPKESQ